jgi:hypothetical protein
MRYIRSKKEKSMNHILHVLTLITIGHVFTVKLICIFNILNSQSELHMKIT